MTQPSTLSGDRRAAMAARLRRGRAAEVTSIPRRSPDLTELPLSFGQEQLWFIDQFAAGSTAYNLAASLRLTGPLDVAALATSLTLLVARHESLRTRLVTVDGQPVQLVDAPREVAPVPVATAATDLADLEITEAATPFDLATGPLFRVRLLALAPEHHVLLVGVHHAVADGWSFGVIVEEITTGYAAAVAGVEPDLPALPVQFADYALWERDRLQGPALDTLVEHWREALHGIDTVALPTDRPRPLLQSADGALARIRMDAELLDGLRALARRESTTLFGVVLAAVQVLLHRYSGQDDIPIGTASANRGRPELGSVIGFLVNTLVARGDLSGDPTFAELLGRVHSWLVDAYAHQELPFAKLVEALRVPRDASRSPLFQTGFTLTEVAPSITVAGLTVAMRGIEILPAKFDLNVIAVVEGGELTVDLSYATALFDQVTAEQLLQGLEALLHGVVADAGRALSALPVMPAEQWRREVHDWNDTAVDYPVITIDERFAQQVAARPDGVAAEFGDETWTYERLDAEANRVARRLQQLGVRPEVFVGVGMAPSLRRLAAIMGILKAGGGYVPLDPDLPAERLTYMAQDADLRVILADHDGALPPTGATVVAMDREWAAIATLDGAAVDRTAEPYDVAYVIYTSGSTGRPKGVVVEHAQVVNFAIGMIEHWPLGEGDKVLQFASLNFDVSAMDMFLSLLSGGCAVFGSRQTLLSPPRLATLMREHRVTFSCLPPAVVTLLTGTDLPDLRVLISAGESLPTELVRDWLRPGLTFCNGYGPTEAAIGATLMVLDGSVFPPPIGRPMPNYRAYVLDRFGNPAPVGVIGELHLGGAGVTRGYLNLPELTAERFVVDPFVTPDTGDARPHRHAPRMYRTGDLVRRMRDGTIAFMGRVDDQVKIRGLRVELGEIESVLASHADVAQAVVIVGEDAAGEKQLVGYVRCDGEPPSVAELRQEAALRLPAYMVPPHLVVLEEFPLTSNGKIDKAALPAPGACELADSYREPTTLLETVLVDMFATLLRCDRFGVDDSFFDLGGNSLQAMRLISALRDELAVDADVATVFLAPTPGQLAERLRVEHGVEDAELDELGMDGSDLEPAVAGGN